MQINGEFVQKFIILFRGINVGGNNLLPMKELVIGLEAHGFKSVSSYIQSGNVVLKSDNEPTETIKKIVTDNFGFSPEIFVIKEAAFDLAVSNNPYNKVDGKFAHFYFCKDAIELNQDYVNKYIADSEQYYVKDNVFYLHAPNGIGRSKLVANIERCLGQKATGRNLNTVNKISGMFEKA